VAVDENLPRAELIDAIANGPPADSAAAAPTVSVAGGVDGPGLDALRVIAAVKNFYRHHNPDRVPATDGRGLSAEPLDARGQPDLSRGEPWGPLIVLDRIDGGSFGDVFRAFDPALKKLVALKRTRYSSAADAARAAHEAQRLANIQPHPNVITVYGACNVNGVVGIWMELLRGLTLQRLVNDEGELGYVEATHYGECVCRALSHIHAAHMLHRDVKPANVMKAAGGRIVLIDFGSGGDIAPIGAGQPERLVGTLPYMAPELFEGRPATQQTDIYSLGVLLFNLVTAKYPVVGNSRGEIEAAHKAGRRELLSDARADLPTPFLKVVEKAIAPDPAQRYRTAGELRNDLAALVSPEPVPITTAPATSARKLAASIAFGVAAAVTGLGMVSSRFFNAAMGRSEFANETVWDWFTWGVTSSVAPTLMAVIAFLALTLLTEGGRLFCDWLSYARAVQIRLIALLRRLRLDEVSNLAACAVLASSVALIVVWWYFTYSNPILSKFIALSSPDISSAPDISFLSPQFESDRQLYRMGFTAAIVASVVAWYPAVRLALWKRERINPWIVAGGTACLLLSLVFLDFPYRFIGWDARKFREVKWRDETCFLLGERQAEELLFCPQQRPRNKIVRSSDPDLRVTEVIGDMFRDVDTPSPDHGR
jgi:hypothetical protein